MRNTILWLALSSLVACTGTDEDEDKPSDDDDDDGDDDGNDETGDSTTGNGTEYWEPVAVGFEYDGSILSNGETGSFFYDDIETGGQIERFPVMFLTFASLAYFDDAGLSDEERAAQTCVALGLFYASPSEVQIPTHDDALLHWSYEVALDIFTEEEDHDCNGKIDPAVWGENAENLLGPFDGARFGYGWGLMTDYLEEPFDQETLDDEEFMNSMRASYVAINDIDGDWEAYDWTWGFAFEWDETTGYQATEPCDDDPEQDCLVRLDVSEVAAASPLPSLYFRSSAYWYQDFPLLDLSNLKDGAP